MEDKKQPVDIDKARDAEKAAEEAENDKVDEITDFLAEKGMSAKFLASAAYNVMDMAEADKEQIEEFANHFKTYLDFMRLELD